MRTKSPSSVRVNLLQSISANTLTWYRPTATLIWQPHQVTPVMGRWGIRMRGEERWHHPNAAQLRATLNETTDLPEEGKQDKTRADKVWDSEMYRHIKWEVQTSLTRGQIINERYAQESAQETGGDLTLSLSCCRCQFSGLFNYCNAVASLLHLAGGINGLHWSTYL